MTAILIIFLALATSPLCGQTPGTLTLEPFTFVTNTGRQVPAEAGTFFVEENREDPASRTITLALVRFPSTSTSPGPPIIYLSGGPGGSGIDDAAGGLFSFMDVMRQFGDVIALDQRGTGASEPNLLCRPKHTVQLVAGELLDLDTASTEIQAKSKRCARWWRKRGVDLDGYNTAQSADDIDELRAALGANMISLWGESYGTHLALAAIKRHGASVHKAILHGAEGPNHTSKLPRNIEINLRRIAEQIQADPVVGTLLPDPIETLQQIIADLALNPRTESVLDPSTGLLTELTFGAEDVRLFFASAMGDDNFFPSIPRILVRAEQGDYQPLADLLIILRRPIRFSAMTFAMDCASGSSRRRWRKILRQEQKTVLGRLIDFPFPEACGVWNVADLGSKFRSQVKSEVRTLFISGTLDGRTPVSNAQSIRGGMPNSEHLVIEGASHDGLFASHPDILNVMLDFMADQPIRTDRLSILPLSFDPVN